MVARELTLATPALTLIARRLTLETSALAVVVSQLSLETRRLTLATSMLTFTAGQVPLQTSALTGATAHHFLQHIDSRARESKTHGHRPRLQKRRYPSCATADKVS